MAIGSKWTDIGQSFAIDQLDINTALVGTGFTYFGAWGSGSTTPAITDTVASFTQNPEARVSIPAGSISQPSSDTIRWVYTVVATGTRTVQEAGIFDIVTSGSGNLYIRIVHGSLALESGDQVTYTINLRLKDDSEA